MCPCPLEARAIEGLSWLRGPVERGVFAARQHLGIGAVIELPLNAQL